MSNCFFHNSQEAVAQCQRCGKNLCRTCSKTYPFSPSDWHGKTLCPKCMSDVLKIEREEMDDCRSEHIGRIIATGIGMAIGIVAGIMIGNSVGEGAALYAILLMFVGGALTGAIKSIIKALITAFKSVIVGTLGGYLSGNLVVGLLIALPMFVWAMIKAAVLVIIEIFKSLYNTIKSVIWVLRYSKSVHQYDEILSKQNN